MDSYWQVRNKVTSMNNQLKKQYFTDRIAACQGNMKESWKAMDELLKKRSKSSNIDCSKDSGTETVHNKDISDTVHSFFCTTGKELTDKIDRNFNPLLTGDYEINKSKTVFNFKTIKVREIRAAFAKIKTTKGARTDNISSYFLKLALPLIENSLAHFFSTSIRTNRFPDSWKVARVTPIFKGDDKTEKSNYRTSQSQSCLSSQGSLKSFYLISCTSI